MFEIFSASAVAILIYMTLWYVVAILKKRNDLADVAWGLGFIVAALTTLIYDGGFETKKLLVLLLVLIWGLRLSIRIGLRNSKKSEDKRYVKWREEWGKFWVVRTFFQVFMLQGLLLLVVVSPVIYLMGSTATELDLYYYLGTAIWLVGFYFESVGDHQLDSFLGDKSNRGKIMKEGLWKYTRHPNYFGEVTMWWGIFLTTISVSGAWVTIVGPITISFLILKVSGVPMLEKMFEGNKDFEEYKRTTSVFFPLPPKK